MPTVAIGCFHEHLPDVTPDCEIVGIDVIRATTTAVTAVTIGRSLYPAGSIGASVGPARAHGCGEAGRRSRSTGARGRVGRRPALWIRHAEQSYRGARTRALNTPHHP